MARRLVAMTGALLGLVGGSAATADELVLSLDQRIGGDSNVFRDEENETADGTYEIRPSILFRQREGTFVYALSYTPTYEVFFDTDDIDGDDHYLRGRLGYQPTSTSEIGLSLDFADYRSLRTDEVLGPAGIVDVVPGISGRVQRLLLGADWSHRFRPDGVVEAEAGFSRYEFSTPNNSDNLGVEGRLAWIHEPRSSYGIGAALFSSYRDFDERSGQPASYNAVVHPSLVLRGEPTPTLSFEVSVGPAWVGTRESRPGPERIDRFLGTRTPTGTEAAVFSPLSCGRIAGQPILDECPLAPAPALADRLDETVFVSYADGLRPGAVEDDRFTVFARARVVKTESWGNASIEFLRREDSAGTGITSIRNSVTAALLLLPGDDWTLELSGNWNRRRTTTKSSSTRVGAGPSDVPFSGPFFYAEAVNLVPDGRSDRVHVDQYIVDASATRDLTERLEITLALRYLRQERDASANLPQRDFETVSGYVGLRYEFDAFELDFF